jgi:tetratricopeptide (TPR) repeat protein
MQFRAALDAADAAGRIYQDLGDEVGQAKVLADRGTFLTAAGNAEAALSELRQALTELPTKARMNRLGAYFQLSRVLTSLGEHRDAAAALGSAERLFEPGQAYYSSCLLYEQGTALAMAGEMEEAVQALRSSLQSLQGLSPSNQARVSLALIEALLQSGNQTEAVREAQGMARLLKPIAAFHPTAEGALAGLLRRAAKISVADVVATRSALSQAIAQHSLQPHLS